MYPPPPRDVSHQSAASSSSSIVASITNSFNQSAASRPISEFLPRNTNNYDHDFRSITAREYYRKNPGSNRGVASSACDLFPPCTSADDGITVNNPPDNPHNHAFFQVNRRLQNYRPPKHLEFSEYYCRTSGSDWGVVPACQFPPPGAHVDYHHKILHCDDGFKVNDLPFRRFDDPGSRDFWRAISNRELPQELQPHNDDSAETKLHRLTIRRDKQTLKPLDSFYPSPPQILSFKKGTPIEEIAAATPPNSTLVEFDTPCDSEETRYLLYPVGCDELWC